MKSEGYLDNETLCARQNRSESLQLISHALLVLGRNFKSILKSNLVSRMVSNWRKIDKFSWYLPLFQRVIPRSNTEYPGYA